MNGDDGWLSAWWLPSCRFEGMETVGLTGGELWMLEGIGAMAFSSADAENVVASFLGLDRLPEWLGPPEACHSVPEGLKEPLAPPLSRGVWYPERLA